MKERHKIQKFYFDMLSPGYCVFGIVILLLFITFFVIDIIINKSTGTDVQLLRYFIIQFMYMIFLVMTINAIQVATICTEILICFGRRRKDIFREAQKLNIIYSIIGGVLYIIGINVLHLFPPIDIVNNFNSDKYKIMSMLLELNHINPVIMLLSAFVIILGGLSLVQMLAYIGKVLGWKMIVTISLIILGLLAITFSPLLRYYMIYFSRGEHMEIHFIVCLIVFIVSLLVNRKLIYKFEV